MLGRALAVGVSLIAGCAAPPPAQDAPPASSAVVVAEPPPAIAPADTAAVTEPTAEPTVEPTAPPTATAAAAPRECVGSDKRQFGSTCCRVTRASDENRFPGQTFLSCEGPQVGRPCKSKRDCDVACSCDADDGPLNPRDERRGPKDGTKGVTGFCSGRRQIGVWMCDIDEKGAVKHIIVD